jgi:integrase/recombinase XerC
VEYRRDVVRFAGFWAATTGEPLPVGDQDQVLPWLAGQIVAVGAVRTAEVGRTWVQALRQRQPIPLVADRGKELSSATIARRVAAVTAFVAWLRDSAMIVWDLRLRTPRVQGVKDVTGPSIEDVRRLLDAAQTQGEPVRRTRDTALVRLLFDLGLRTQEALGLTLADVDPAWDPMAGARIRIRGKGRHGLQTLRLARGTWDAVQAWLDIRGREDQVVASTPGSDPVATVARPAALFLGDRGDQLTHPALYRILARLSMAAGLDRTVRPHGLRHAAVTRALDRTGGDLRAVMALSRHAQVDTLRRYDDHRQADQARITDILAEDLDARPAKEGVSTTERP